MVGLKETDSHPHVCALYKKVFKLLTLASRCRPISKASSIQQAAGGWCRSTLRAPGRRKPKNAALWGFKQCAPWDLHPWSICQFVHVGKVKQESMLYEGQPNSFALSLEVINSWNHSDQSSAGEETVKLGHLCQFFEDESSKSTLATSEGSFPSSRQLTDTKAAAVHYDNITPKVSHILSLYSIHPHGTHDRGLNKQQMFQTMSVKTCASYFNCPFYYCHRSPSLKSKPIGVLWHQ